jgi:hypothetical protein
MTDDDLEAICAFTRSPGIHPAPAAGADCAGQVTLPATPTKPGLRASPARFAWRLTDARDAGRAGCG